MRELTPQRSEKIKKVLSKKQPDLTVILEDVHDPHNVFAVLRSCDAVGIVDAYIIDTVGHWDDDGHLIRKGQRSSSSANKWIDLHIFRNVEDCFSAVRTKFDRILCTHLGDVPSTSLYDVDLTEKVALVFGNEKDGVSDKTLSLCDENFYIPMHGMIQSLNISVACAVSLYEVLRQRELAGHYQSPKWDSDQLENRYNDWSQR